MVFGRSRESALIIIITHIMSIPTKEAIIYLVDVSRTMGGPVGSVKVEVGHHEGGAVDGGSKPGEEEVKTPPMTRLDLVRQGVVTHLHQAALDRPKSTEVGVILYGSSTTDNMVYASMEEEDRADYEHVQELVMLQTAKMEVVPVVDHALQHPSKRHGDLMAGMVGLVHAMAAAVGGMVITDS